MLRISGGKVGKLLKNKTLVTNRPLHHYDEEWIYLITEAKEAGLTIAEVREFLIKENNQRKIT